MKTFYFSLNSWTVKFFSPTFVIRQSHDAPFQQTRVCLNNRVEFIDSLYRYNYVNIAIIAFRNLSLHEQRYLLRLRRVYRTRCIEHKSVTVTLFENVVRKATSRRNVHAISQCSKYSQIVDIFRTRFVFLVICIYPTRKATVSQHLLYIFSLHLYTNQ